MTYVLSDIHGNIKRFESIMSQINLKPEDDLYILGDVIDRFPYGITILRQIMNMSNVHMLLGNHEYMMMDGLRFPYEYKGCTASISIPEKLYQWYSNGGVETHKEWMTLTAPQKLDVKDYLKSLPLNFDVTVNDKAFKLVHAVPCELFDMLMENHEEDMEGMTKAYFCVWEREIIHCFENVEEFTTIFGHTPTINFQDQNPLEIYKRGNIIGIDCGAGWPDPTLDEPMQPRLACLRLDDMKVFYSHEPALKRTRR